jgi:glutaredoxin
MVYFVYGITDCPACLRACADLMEEGLEYVFIETDFAKSYRTQLKKEYKHSTFPIIIKRNEVETLIIGGHDELTRHLNSKEGAIT